MHYYKREITPQLIAAAKMFPSIVLSGPRRAGKTTLLRKAFPKASYYLLEDPDLILRVKADPRGWLEEIQTPVIIDEIQNAPELFAFIRSKIDESPGHKGRWLLTGSQEFSLMNGVVESMAGRAAIFELLPLSFREVGSWNLIRGSFPEVVNKPRSANVWFRSYIQTYLERDVRALKAIRDLSVFRRFLSLLTSRHGQILNKTDLASPLGISVPTLTEWLSILEVTGEIILLQPFYENFGKRLIKSPKIYWLDSGLVCYLLGIESNQQLIKSPFIGPVFEGFIASEIIKNQINQGKRKELYYFRDEQGLEIDFIRPLAAGALELIEVKHSRTIVPQMAASMKSLRKNIEGRQIESVVIHLQGKKPSTQKMTTLDKNEKALSVEDYFKSTF